LLELCMERGRSIRETEKQITSKKASDFVEKGVKKGNHSSVQAG